MLAHYHKTKAQEGRSCIICGTSFMVTAKAHRRACSEECSRQRVRRNGATRRARVRGAFVESVTPAQIFERDGWRCHICRRKLRAGTTVPHPRAATIDHLIPLSVGGSHEPANVKTACYGCNTAKGNRGGNEQLLLIG